ncbi:bifunctional demethylmenaquinone methyltransferase/2-methoxy-6-polyprenyl-1,4-benzoquinol methylase UbiE [Curvivirga aplysinae]|uniref:bifunctional demethylmenaquinone methyltransferase/2-methoxy-6-polyprenyl-1,4-benzoquinol methylase UbiE n=1 Tax=Curvivirga aplysinae TaxID=2529852 RepID=UPI0012BBA98E|nr:bifunctional demethylmenaquinone methyltransferase/2-methoxy-6-polyprenyl-1,4-benzoquinol methylase UbiE [Curvivirga aplysinae]MTI08930.1 bifunctional demethylmenaquinone methyltransferase/2-methoxy-6-polyprenyl-1,4-benzoquinol methylase UbiE [Curvivirga aplysinae]
MATETHNPHYDSTSDTASFGFTDVTADEKPELVQGVFESVAKNYDIMNDLMSAGVHRLWKNTLMDMIKPRADQHLLDVAGGTGDIAFRFMQNGGGHVTVCDLTEGMVRVGRDRAIDQAILDGIDWTVGNAEDLPMPSSSVDVYTIAFGLRNVPRTLQALREAYRVLKPGGRFFCLEFSKVIIPGFDKMYDEYSFKLLPKIGEVVAKDRESYVYLVESIRRFPDQETLKGLMREAGFDQVKHRNLSGGIAAIHSGWKL